MIKSISGATIKFLVVSPINGYQRFISPYKGYHCAHAQMHGGLSCSGYALLVIDEYGVPNGLDLLFDRFRACQAAANGDRSPGTWYCIPICIPLPCGSVDKR